MKTSSKSSRKISVVLPTYNGLRYLPGAVENCLRQQSVELELVIVDDGSRDGTAGYLATLTDARIKIITQPQNRGLPCALNTGFAQTTGEYLTWTSDDNLYAPDALATMAAYLDEHEEIAMVCAPYWEIDEAGNTLRLNPLPSVEDIWTNNPVGACFLYRKSVYETIGQYDPEARFIEDYEYWLRVSQRFQIANIETPLYYYRLHPASLTTQSGVRFGRQRLIAQLKWKRFGQPWLKYWLKMAAIDIEEAFACYRDGLYAQVPRLALRGIARDPRWLANLGVSHITARSLVKIWNRHGR